jgi:tRNA threonylcarbamoyladenosine biosynthesis protein TsaE
MKQHVAQTLEDLPFVAQELLNDLDNRKVIALEGEMGAGKTTFIRALCNAMGVTDEISSPTYGYVNEYESSYFGTVYHFDLYRLETEHDALDIGIEEYIYSDSICLIEWPRVAERILPEDTIWVSIKVSDSEQREIEWN